MQTPCLFQNRADHADSLIHGLHKGGTLKEQGRLVTSSIMPFFESLRYHEPQKETS